MSPILQMKKRRFMEMKDSFMLAKLVSGKIGSHRSKFHGFNKTHRKIIFKKVEFLMALERHESCVMRTLSTSCL